MADSLAQELQQYKAKPTATNDLSGELAQYAIKPSTPSTQKPALRGDPGAQSFGSPTSVHDSLIRTFGSAGQALIGAIPGIYHAFADAPTGEERQQFGLGADPDLVQRAALGAGRMMYKPVTTAVQDYADGRVGVDDALSVADQAVGGAGGTVIGGKLLDVASGAIKDVAPPALRGAIKGTNTAFKNYPRSTGIALGSGLGAAAGALTGTPYLTEAGASLGGLIGGGIGEEILPKIKIPGENFGLKPAQGSLDFKAPAAPAEPQIPGVNARPSVERLDQFNMEAPIKRASEPPAPGNPSAVQVKPSIERITEAPSAKPVAAEASASAGSPIERASIATATAKPVEAPATAPASAKPSGPPKPSRVDYQFGEHASKFDPRNPEHTRIMEMRHSELATEANRLKVDGKSDWVEKDMSRSTKATGKSSSPNAQKVRGQLLDEQNGEVPPGLKRTPSDTSKDITQVANKDVKAPGRGVASARDVSVDPKFEANMRQRASEATAAREKLGPLGLRNQQLPGVSTVGPETKVKGYYNKYGKLK